MKPFTEILTPHSWQRKTVRKLVVCKFPRCLFKHRIKQVIVSFLEVLDKTEKAQFTFQKRMKLLITC